MERTHTGYSVGEGRGHVVFSALQPAAEPLLYLHFPSYTSCTALAASTGAVFLNSWQFRNAELSGPPEYSQPSGGLSWYQGLSPHIPLPFPLQEGRSIVSLPVPLSVLAGIRGASCGMLLRDSKALC